jgi:hypothetical protein
MVFLFFLATAYIPSIAGAPISVKLSCTYMYDFAACLWKFPHSLEICSFFSDLCSEGSPKDHYFLVDVEKREKVLSGPFSVIASSQIIMGGEMSTVTLRRVWHDCCSLFWQDSISERKRHECSRPGEKSLTACKFINLL